MSVTFAHCRPFRAPLGPLLSLSPSLSLPWKTHFATKNAAVGNRLKGTLHPWDKNPDFWVNWETRSTFLVSFWCSMCVLRNFEITAVRMTQNASRMTQNASAVRRRRTRKNYTPFLSQKRHKLHRQPTGCPLEFVTPRTLSDRTPTLLPASASRLTTHLTWAKLVGYFQVI